MAYTKTMWKDRATEKSRTFNLQNNPDGTVTLIPVTGVVYEAGTPVNSVNMNKIEQGIANALTLENQVLIERRMMLTNENWNNLITTGMYTFWDTSAQSNNPGFSWGVAEVYTSGSYVVQRATSLAANATKYRTRDENGTWIQWITVWTSKNQGTGSGLDADLFNGMGLSKFVVDRGGLPSNVNWNTFTAPGTYTYGDTSSMSNHPNIGSYGIVEVYNTGGYYIIQRATTLTGQRTSYRWRNESNAWSQWNEYWHSGNIPQTRDNAGVLEFYTGGVWRPVGGVKQVQRGTASVTNGASTDIAINPVVMGKTMVNMPASAAATSPTTSVGAVYAELISSTIVRFTNNNPTFAFTLAYEVVESY